MYQLITLAVLSFGCVWFEPAWELKRSQVCNDDTGIDREMRVVPCALSRD